LSAPKDLPASIVSRLNTEARVALKTPVMRDMMEREGSDPLDTDSAGFTTMIAGEVARWSKILATMDIRLEE
jgi:tripartite-type tricarboxylate transporter receptor subunit TctC